jgi:hypothetical protein
VYEACLDVPLFEIITGKAFSCTWNRQVARRFPSAITACYANMNMLKSFFPLMKAKA